MELTNEVYNAIGRYFSVLTHLGYKAYSEVDKLLVLSFIEELLDSELAFFMTEEDYNIIARAVECLYGSCMIPYPDYKRASDSIVYQAPDRYKITERGFIRSTEDINVRVNS